MKNPVTKLLALALTAAMVLAGCGGAEQSTSTPENDETKEASSTQDEKELEKEEVKESEKEEQKDKHQIDDLVITKAAAHEIETFNILYSQRAYDYEELTNVVDGLLEADSYGKLVPCLAESWGSEDGGLTWKFDIRDGVKWVDVNGKEKADCNAYDFATGLEWVLNFHKNDASNISMPAEMIKGAQEYYEYTKNLSKEEAYALDASEGSKFLEMVGIKVPDEHTVIYECTTQIPYFDSVATYVCLYPMSAAMVEELGGIDSVKSMTNENMWCNGCYTMTEYIQGNEKVYTKNPMYWDKDCYRFNTVTCKMVESGDITYQLFQNGEVDETALTESQLSIIHDNPEDKYYDYLTETSPSQYSYQIHFNFNKKNEDGTVDTNWNTAVANKAFRQSIYYGLDLENYWKRINAINPVKCENLFYTMKGLCYLKDGKEYTELVREGLGMPEQDGKTNIRLNADKAAELKKQAMEELTALGVTFPIQMDHYIAAGNQTNLDSANVLKQAVEDCLGTDYIDFQIKTFISKFNSEVVVPHLHCFGISGWSADYGDPQNYLGQETYQDDSAYFSQNYSYINEVEESPATKELLDTYKKYTEMVQKANAITDDTDARYKAYAEAEIYFLDNALVVPCNVWPSWKITKINAHSKINAMYGCVNEKMKNWETKADEPYTTEEMEQIAAEYAAATK